MGIFKKPKNKTFYFLFVNIFKKKNILFEDDSNKLPKNLNSVEMTAHDATNTDVMSLNDVPFAMHNSRVSTPSTYRIQKVNLSIRRVHLLNLKQE